jgi:hypothetical protein
MNGDRVLIKSIQTIMRANKKNVTDTTSSKVDGGWRQEMLQLDTR